MSRKLKEESSTLDIKGYATPYCGSKTKKKKPWYMQTNSDLKESILMTLEMKKRSLLEAEDEDEKKKEKPATSQVFKAVKSDESELGLSLADAMEFLKTSATAKTKEDLIKSQASIITRLLKKDPGEYNQGEKFVYDDLVKKFGQDYLSKVKDNLAKSKKKEDSPDIERIKSRGFKKEKEEDTGPAYAMAAIKAAEQAKRILPSFKQVKEADPQLAKEIDSVYYSKNRKNLPGAFRNWSEKEFPKELVQKVKDLKVQVDAPPKKVVARGAQFSKPKIKQKKMHKVDPSQVGSSKPRFKDFKDIDKELGLSSGEAHKTLRSIVGRVVMALIGDDDTWPVVLDMISRVTGVSPERTQEIIDAYNDLVDEHDRNPDSDIKISEFLDEPLSPKEKEAFFGEGGVMEKLEDFYPQLSQVYNVEGLPSGQPSKFDDLKKLDPPKARSIARYEPGHVTDVEKKFSDVFRAGIGRPEGKIEDLGIKHPEAVKTMVHVFKRALEKGDESIIPANLLPVVYVDENGDKQVINSISDLVKFTQGGAISSFGETEDQFKAFLLDFAEDHPEEFEALRSKTYRVIKKRDPDVFEKEKSVRSSDAMEEFETEPTDPTTQRDIKPAKLGSLMGLSKEKDDDGDDFFSSISDLERELERSEKRLSGISPKESELEQIEQEGELEGTDQERADLADLTRKHLAPSSKFSLSDILAKASREADEPSPEEREMALARKKRAERNRRLKRPLPIDRTKTEPKEPEEKISDLSKFDDLFAAFQQKRSKKEQEKEEAERRKQWRQDPNAYLTMQAQRVVKAASEKGIPPVEIFMKYKNRFGEENLKKALAPYLKKYTAVSGPPKPPVEESLRLIDDSKADFTPTTQDKKGWEKGKPELKKTYVKMPSLKGLLGDMIEVEPYDGECDDD